MDVILYGAIYHTENVVEEFVHVAVLFEKVNHRFIAASELFVRLVATGIMEEAAIKYKTTAIAGIILGNTRKLVGEAVDIYRQEAACSLDFVKRLVALGVYDPAHGLGKFRKFKGERPLIKKGFDIAQGMRNTF